MRTVVFRVMAGFVGAALMGWAQGGSAAPAAPQGRPGAAAADGASAPAPPGPGLYATFDTSQGRIVARLLEDTAPQAVLNFVALANGVKPSADAGGHMVKKRFFDGLIFHRVIRGFMIQTGDINGTGDSDCGVNAIPDEIDPAVRFDAPGRLAMANTGAPNTAACQIFITVGAAPYLNGKFTIFGIVTSGQDVADRIAAVPAAASRPLTPVVLNQVTIERREQ